MRLVKNKQMQLEEVDITKIKLDSKSRDDIPKILAGLQHLYSNKEIREQIFKALEKMIPSKVNKDNGRPGMQLWQIFVLGMLRLNLNIDYDRLQSLANQYKNIRQMLGHGSWDKTYYKCQTLKDNLRLFTPEILDEINQMVVMEEIRPGKGPGQSRAHYTRYKNNEGKTIRTYKDSYDRAGKFQGRKLLTGGPEGRVK
jgi:hypothetical protein